MTSTRDTILGTIRRSLGVNGTESPRRDAVNQRLENRPRGVIPARAQVSPAERIELFKAQAEAVSTTIDRVADASAVPEVIAAYLRERNLPQRLRIGLDPALNAVPWASQPTLDVVAGGASDGHDLVSVSKAVGGIAETGTLVLVSGTDNPTSLNFLPDTHIVLLDAADMTGDMESLWERLRTRFGAGIMPRTVNFITGPSRSGDIEQTILLGAHGPRQLHVVIIG